MDYMRVFHKCFFGPALYRLYKSESCASGRSYTANRLERHSQQLLDVARSCLIFCQYISPILGIYLYRRNYLTSLDFISRSALFCAVVFGGGFVVRGIGRLLNSDYRLFALDLIRAHRSLNRTEAHKILHRYDFSFWAWQPDYFFLPDSEFGPAPVMLQPVSGKGWLLETACYMAAHTIGRAMIYPGSLSLMQALVRPMLDTGRAKLFETHCARRYKLMTQSNRGIESVFVDKRRSEADCSTPQQQRGNTLVITCEGNAGYLEIGCMATPLECGYSVLGWNHPGFGGSEGLPYPQQEHEAVEVVVQFAMERLGFAPEKIVLLGWSIGGYTVSWGLRRYPALGAAVIDATFDDIMPLALSRMPTSWNSLVQHTIRKHFDLHVAEHLRHYQGPVQLIRRSRDEVIHTATSVGASALEQMQENRANSLLKTMLFRRYPRLNDSGEVDLALNEFFRLAQPQERVDLLRRHGVDAEHCASILRIHITNAASPFPCDVAANLNAVERVRLALFLAHHYLVDFDATHCIPLPGRYLDSLPRHPWQITGLVD